MPKLFSSPRASAIAPVMIKSSASTARSSPSSTEGSTNNAASSSPPMAKANLARAPSSSARVQPLHPRESHIEERGKLDIWMLGLTIVIGGQYFSWNAGLSAGFWSYLIAYIVVTFAYIILCCCTAEITGALPFAGGAYGLSRCTLGFFPGFMIGCCEALEYIAYVSTTTIFLADLIVASVPGLKGAEPLIWLVFYISALAIQIKGGRVFWGFNLAIGGISLLVVLVYIFGSLPHVDFAKHTASDPHIGFVGGFSGFMHALPVATWFFVGVEALPMASDDVIRPKTIVPKAQVYCVLTLAATGLMVYFVTASLPLGEGGLTGLSTTLAPLNNGFKLMFKISTTAATMLSLPATYATAFGFIWCYGKLIHSMATSRLLPPILARSTDLTGIPYMALLAGSAASYALCVVVYCVPQISPHLFPICITSAFVAYSGQCIGYISLKKNYRNIKSSHFASPFGVSGALFSLTVWAFGLVSIAGFQNDHQIEILAFLGIVVILVAFYYAYAKKRQTFSPQENKVLLVAHVMKFNATRFSGKSKSKSKTTSRGTVTNVRTNHSNHTKHSSHANVSEFKGASEGAASDHSVAEVANE